MVRRIALLGVVALAVTVTGCRLLPVKTISYNVRISVDPSSPTPIAPVAWAVHTGPNPFFELYTENRLDGLEALAEDGDPTAAAAALAALPEVLSSGIANTPSGSSGPGAATPGTYYSFDIEMDENDRLSFATMYVQSNDLFYSADDIGITLLDLIGSHDITDIMVLYDAGTEQNEEPGVGPNQAPRQTGPNTGPDEGGTVRPIEDVNDGFAYPATEDVIRVTITIE